MLSARNVRTGIDIGSHSIKLVRGTGDHRLRKVTHFGRENWTGDHDPQAAGRALATLLRRLDLERKQLGRVATAVDAWDGGCREVVAPALSEADFSRALPYEVRRFLNLDSIAAPVVAGQILGPAPEDAAAPGPQNRVLLAAVPGARRSFVLSVLAQVGLEPAVIDLEPLAGANALHTATASGAQEAMGLLDIGAARAGLVLSCPSGGLLSRVVGPGLAAPLPAGGVAAYADALLERIAETFTYFRGRFHRRVAGLVLAGGGALHAELRETLGGLLDVPVTLARPLAALGAGSPLDEEPLYITACGLCQWGDSDAV